MKMIFSPWVMIFISALLECLSIYFIKLRFNELGNINVSSFSLVVNYLINFIKSPYAVFAIFAFIASPLLWFFALSKIELSYGYPVSIALKLILIFLSSYLFLHEKINQSKVIGVILLLISLFLLNK